MGSDKLVQLVTAIGNTRLSIRLFDEAPLFDDRLALGIMNDKLSIFCQQTGLRLEGNHE
jgi:hypothetical protein